MIVIGILFLILFAFFGLCLIGMLSILQKTLELVINRQNELIKELKNSK